MKLRLLFACGAAFLGMGSGAVEVFGQPFSEPFGSTPLGPQLRCAPSADLFEPRCFYAPPSAYMPPAFNPPPGQGAMIPPFPPPTFPFCNPRHTNTPCLGPRGTSGDLYVYWPNGSVTPLEDVGVGWR